MGRVGGPQVSSWAFSRRCPGKSLHKSQAEPRWQQTEMSDGSGAGGSLLVCERLGFKPLIFHKQSRLTLGKSLYPSCPSGIWDA